MKKSTVKELISFRESAKRVIAHFDPLVEAECGAPKCPDDSMREYCFKLFIAMGIAAEAPVKLKQLRTKQKQLRTGFRNLQREIETFYLKFVVSQQRALRAKSPRAHNAQ